METVGEEFFEDGLYTPKCNMTIRKDSNIGINFHKGELWIYSKKNNLLKRGNVSLYVYTSELSNFFEKYTP